MSVQMVLIVDVAEADVEAFLAYERRVLPVLAEYGDLRTRLASTTAVAEHGEEPRQVRRSSPGPRTEVHHVVFPDEAAFEGFRTDPRRVEAQRDLHHLDLSHRLLVVDDV